jgi:hypothetical protein
MHKVTKLSIAVLCALGVTAVTAQTVERDGKEVKPAQTRAPVSTAQAPAGGAAAGGAAGGATAAVGATTAGTVAFVGMAAFTVVGAAANSDNGAAVTHNP